MKIEDFDKNLVVDSSITEDEEIVWFDVRHDPMKVYGLYDYKNTEHFMRLPLDIANKANGGVAAFSDSTAGGRIRFKTDSKFIALSVEYHDPMDLTGAFSPLGQSGFDFFAKFGNKYEFIRSFIPPVDAQKFSALKYTRRQEMTEYIIYMPPYQRVKNVYVGLDKNSSIEETEGYPDDKPMVFYGSSITHGCMASRPGNSYVNILSRRFDTDIINLGFSGHATGEPAMAEYIAGFDMKLFVLDYDHNAPDAEYLKKTHEPFFKIIRKAHPDLPIVMVTRPDFEIEPDKCIERRTVVKQTYDNAVAAGDKNVWFVDGEKLFMSENRELCTADGTHPNDLGFYRMSCVIGDEIQKALDAKKN